VVGAVNWASHHRTFISLLLVLSHIVKVVHFKRH